MRYQPERVILTAQEHADLETYQAFPFGPSDIGGPNAALERAAWRRGKQLAAQLPDPYIRVEVRE